LFWGEKPIYSAPVIDLFTKKFTLQLPIWSLFGQFQPEIPQNFSPAAQIFASGITRPAFDRHDVQHLSLAWGYPA
jgi:hypothetical protein